MTTLCRPKWMPILSDIGLLENKCSYNTSPYVESEVSEVRSLIYLDKRCSDNRGSTVYLPLDWYSLTYYYYYCLSFLRKDLTIGNITKNKNFKIHGFF